ncbi:hypothetical protein N1031_10105 [Herbiconiux moechotypicola]|uniref:Uncharacterized protein n=1 Tax=Herbiconiux moechotypicola TaxID=637393 RepID=A0ABN3DKZ5_9MICO|nr:hypothetical protein [Herbiconiux moechotypicola]MCS5730114.1 hypothetical protein [Herbiconiux moechotypicola]
MVVAAGAAVALAGCTQVAALAPVGGNAVAEVRYGAIDVLLAHGVDLLEVPTCAAADDDTSSPAATPATPAGTGGTIVTCTGSTTSGQAIEVVSSTAADAVLTVTVDGDTLFTGDLQQVLDEAARP